LGRRVALDGCIQDSAHAARLDVGDAFRPVRFATCDGDHSGASGVVLYGSW
jgi:hypothetical protein